MDGEHINSKPGSKGLRSREQGAGRKEEGAFSRHKTVSSESQQVFSIWLVDVIWEHKSEDEWW